MKLYHFDTIHGTYPSTNVYDSCKFTLEEPLINISKVYLKTLEMPISFNNIRTGLNVMTLIVESVTYSKTLTANNYTDMSQLCTDLTTLFGSFIPNCTITFAVNGSNIRVSLTSSSVTTFTIQQTNFSRFIFGFDNSETLTTIGTLKYYTSNNHYSLVPDTYIFIKTNLPGETLNSGRHTIHYKIQYDSNFDLIQFNTDNATYHQAITIQNKYYIMNEIVFTIMDRFGNVLDGNDYSFSLAFEERE